MANPNLMDDFEYFRDPRDVRAEEQANYEAMDGKWAQFMVGTEHANEAGLSDIENDAADEIFSHTDREHARDEYIEEQVRSGIYRSGFPMDEEDIDSAVISWVEKDRQRRSDHSSKISQ